MDQSPSSIAPPTKSISRREFAAWASIVFLLSCWFPAGLSAYVYWDALTFAANAGNQAIDFSKRRSDSDRNFTKEVSEIDRRFFSELLAIRDERIEKLEKRIAELENPQQKKEPILLLPLQPPLKRELPDIDR